MTSIRIRILATLLPPDAGRSLPGPTSFAIEGASVVRSASRASLVRPGPTDKSTLWRTGVPSGHPNDTLLEVIVPNMRTDLGWDRGTIAVVRKAC